LFFGLSTERARRIGWRHTLRVIAVLFVVSGVHATIREIGAQVPGEARGRVIDVRSGQAIDGARIEVVGRATYALSDAAGSFVLRGLEPGTFSVRARALGYLPSDTAIAITNGRSTTIDFVLQRVASRLNPIVVRSERDSTNALRFNRQTIEQSARRDLGDLLQSVPGVVITRAGGPGSPSRISIRGSGANEVLVLVDGNAINSTITGEADLSTISLEMVDNVEVLPGAQSARYGGRALAGVVVIETRRAERDASGSASLGAWGERNASMTLGRAQRTQQMRAIGSIAADYRDVRGDFSYEVPDVRGGGIARRVNADARTVGLLATASIDGNDEAPGGLQIRAEWQRRTRGLPGSIVQPSTTGRQRDSRLAGGLDVRRSFDRATWTANVDATHEHATFADPAPPFGTTYDDAVDANSLRVATTGTVASSVASLTAGGESRTLGVTSTMLAPGAPRRQQQWGTWSSVHSSHLGANGVELAADVSARADWDSFLPGASVSPRASLTASRGPATIAASFGGGYTPPSLADQFFHEGVLVRPNPSLRPERVRREIELRAGVRDTRVGIVDVAGDVSVYRADIDGMILWLPDFRFIWSPSNFDVRRRGWEMNGHLAVPSLHVDVRGSVNRSDVSYVGPVLGGQVAYRPRTTASVAAGVSHWGARLQSTTRYIGARRSVPGSQLNLLDSYSLSDVALSRPFARGSWSLDVTLGVENVFDRSASMLADYPFPGRAWTVAFRTRRR
jgi:vitamin B12 transporter